MRTADFHYTLPESAVAQRPSARRDGCRLAVAERATGIVRHLRFTDLPSLLRPGDLLVLNDSKVLKARIPCRRASGGSVEIFLLGPEPRDGLLSVFLRPAGKIKFGELLRPELDPASGGFLLKTRSPEGIFGVQWQGRRAWSPALLAHLGLAPLPPYIRRKKVPEPRQRALDVSHYQTVYAGPEGSVAAPTAGLHFTRGLLARLKTAGVDTAEVTLHVGAGTFQPVKTEHLEDHRMHEELCEVPARTAQAIQACRRRGGRVIAVGTTALRTLESCALDQGGFRVGWVRTRLYILPGYTFHGIDGLITNFHQPGSTLLPLVSAFWDRSKVLELYQDCLRLNYRFLSFGDACFFF